MISTEELYRAAKETVRPMNLKKEASAGHVACAPETKSGKVFTGICIDMPCSLGFCAEQAAIAQMLKSGETEISKIIAVDRKGKILPPCGRCREFISRVDEKNLETAVILPGEIECKLKDLLPDRWDAG